MTKEQKLKQVANLIGMLESKQNELLAEGYDVDLDISNVLDDAISGLTDIWNDLSNNEYFF